jgi:hypothetical protein
MFSTYAGAKKRSRALHTTLTTVELEVTLTQCQYALARGAGYRDWQHLRRSLDGRPARPAPLDGFLERAALSMPAQAVGPTHRWVETELSSIKARERAEPPINREFREWYVKDFEVTMAIGVLHRSTTPLLCPGSGRGQRLRQELAVGLCLGSPHPVLDRKTFTLMFKGTVEELFGRHAAHPHFLREFDRLVNAGLFAWRAAPEGGIDLVLSPPPLTLVRDHIRKCRDLDAEHWRMDAEFRAAARAEQSGAGWTEAASTVN